MWFAHFIVPMIIYYMLFPYLNAYSLLIGAFFANIDAIIVKMGLKDSKFHLNSFFHSIPFGLLFSLVFLPFGIKDVISFNIGHIIHILLDSGSDGGIRPLYPLKFNLNFKIWKNTFSLGFRDDFIHYFSKNYFFEVLAFLILILLIPKEILEIFGSYKILVFITSFLSIILFLKMDFLQAKIFGIIFSISSLISIILDTTILGYFYLALLFNLFISMIYTSVEEEKLQSTAFFILISFIFTFFLIYLLEENLVPIVATLLAFLGLILSIGGIWIKCILNQFRKNDAPTGI